MELTPNDIRNLEFSNALRGYDKDAVDTFKEQVAKALESAKQENVKLNMELESMRIQLAGVKQFEDTIKSAAIDARRSADLLVAGARKEAEQITAAAKVESEKLLATRSDNVRDLELRLQNLELVKKSFVTKLRGMIESHLELVKEIAAEKTPAIPPQPHRREDTIDITESSEVHRSARETIATQPSKPEPTVLEEANAAGSIIAAAQQANAEIRSLAQALRGEGNAVVDPELAAALENYNKAAQSQGMSSEHNPHTKDTQPIPITSNALGRITTFNNDQPADETDRNQVVNDDPDAQTEHNAINIDQPISSDPIADKLAKELDEVAAKFEEEMDRASRG